MSEWQTIETAPRDTPILLCCNVINYDPFVGTIYTNAKISYEGSNPSTYAFPDLENYDDELGEYAIYWQPLPPVPTP